MPSKTCQRLRHCFFEGRRLSRSDTDVKDEHFSRADGSEVSKPERATLEVAHSARVEPLCRPTLSEPRMLQC